MTARVRAPELVGSGGWVNTTRPLRLRDLRGRIVLLDFWTAGCVNCVHVLRELAGLEDALGDVLTVIGVHSPKFARERDHASVAAAVVRMGVRHPVLDDPEMVTWDAYAVRGWPTLVLVDPDGYVALVAPGEGNAARIAAAVRGVAADADARGVLVRGPLPEAVPGAAIPPHPATRLRFPGRVVRLVLSMPDGEREVLAVADTGHHRVVVCDPSGAVLAVAGTGRPGGDDGPLDVATLRGPQGLAAWRGDLVVADTGNHLVRRIDLRTGTVTTLAGTGAVGTGPLLPGPARRAALRSPWDLAPWDGGLAVALAGSHQLALLDPAAGRIGHLAGTGSENLVDGPAREALLAQPTGLAVHRDGLLLTDAESSSLRVLRGGRVETLVGQGLFVSGHRDGPAADALLQHPAGVAVTATGTVVVADAYNGAVRAYGPATRTVATLAAGLTDPGGVAPLADGSLVVADTGAHRLVRIAGGETRAFPLPGLAPPGAWDPDLACLGAC